MLINQSNWKKVLKTSNWNLNLSLMEAIILIHHTYQPRKCSTKFRPHTLTLSFCSNIFQMTHIISKFGILNTTTKACRLMTFWMHKCAHFKKKLQNSRVRTTPCKISINFINRIGSYLFTRKMGASTMDEYVKARNMMCHQKVLSIYLMILS